MKVFITGIGCISGIGRNIKEHLDAFRENKDGLGKVTLFPTCHTEPVSEVKLRNEELKKLAGIPVDKTYSRTALLGIVAAREALRDAGINNIENLRIGLVSSTSTGGMDLTELFYPAFRQDNKAGRLRYVASHDAGDSTERIAQHLGITGFRTTVSTACSSAANAIMLAARMIKAGILDIVIAGGTDALCKFTLNGFGSLMILDKEPCRPFDQSRAGLNLGEGAGYIVLQSSSTIINKPYCELTGYANTNDAFHQTASSSEGTGAYLAMKEALEEAHLLPEDIDYINAHGTGTPNNDASESTAIRKLFGEKVPPFSSTKPFTGHTLGAAGGLEAVFSILSIRHGILYPVKNFTTPIHETGLIPIRKYQENQPIKTVLSNSFGFGGNNTTLIFRETSTMLNISDVPIPEPEIYINAITSNYDLQKNKENNCQLSIVNCQLTKSLVPDATVRRRMSRLVRMGVATGLQCLTNVNDIQPDAIITATGLGCLADTEKFMNSILDNKEELLSPTAFIQSTFNTVGSQIALLTSNNCYNTTYVHRGLSLESALLDAMLRLREGKAKYVLVGSMDERTPLLGSVLERFGTYRKTDRTTPGEGVSFLLLSTEKTDNSIAVLDKIEMFSGKVPEHIIKNQANWYKPEDYKQLCGDFPTAVSFALWSTLSKEISRPLVLFNSYLDNHSLISLRPIEE